MSNRVFSFRFSKRKEKDLLGVLHIYVVQPPLKGKANKAAIEALAKHFKTKKSNIFLISGIKSKSKIFEIRSNNG
jgi:uncharacterized protein YggU (UPF0235/DUF167 family)